jgi:hypothetical protein
MNAGGLACEEARRHFLSIAHPEMANLPDIGVTRKILSSEYQQYACGKIFRAS